MLRTCVVLTVALVAAGAGANSTRGAELWSLLQVWRPALQLQWSDSPALSAQCGASMQRFSRALGERQQWASKMLDASGQPSSQFLEGNDYWLGSRSECEDSRDDNHVAPVFRVASLSVNLSEPLVTPQLKDLVQGALQPRRVYLGMCLPSECGAVGDVRSLLELMIDNTETKNVQNFREVQIHSIKALGDDSIWSQPATGLLMLLSFTVIAMVLLGTIIDLMKLGKPNPKLNVKEGLWREMVVSFSLGRTSRSLFSTRSKDGSLTAINGMRVIGMSWIILCHMGRYAIIFGENPLFRRQMESDLLYQVVSSGTYSVDTFLFISGVLIAYIFLGVESKNSVKSEHDSFLQSVYKFTWISVYRVFRLALPYMFTIVLMLVSMRYLNDNSVFEPSVMDHVVCAETWWRNLLYVNNLFPVSEMCMSWTWYLGVDTQLYVLATVLLLLFINGRCGLAVISGFMLLLISWITTGAISFSLDFIPTTEDPAKYFDYLHDKPWLRLGPYFVGVATGWYLHKTNSKVNMGRTVVAMGWVSCVIVMLGIVHALYFHPFGVLMSAVYVSLSHTLWGACMAWILVACTTGYGGWASKILSSKLFAPFGRATYCTYLIHYPLMEWIFLNMEGPLSVSRSIMVPLVFGFILSSYLLGMLMSLVLEAPVLRMLSLAHPMKQKQEYQPPATQPEDEMSVIVTNQNASL